jgi:hypothetical protein
MCILDFNHSLFNDKQLVFGSYDFMSIECLCEKVGKPDFKVAYSLRQRCGGEGFCLLCEYLFLHKKERARRQVRFPWVHLRHCLRPSPAAKGGI